MKTVSIGLFLALACASSSFAADNRVLTSEGLGPVRIGMTVKQAEAALGDPLAVDYSANAACGIAARQDGKDVNVTYMVERGRITRIDVFRNRKAPVAGIDITTQSGLGLGSSEAVVRKTLGSALVVTPDPYDNNTPDMEIDAAGGRRGVLFVIQDGRVASMTAGRKPSINYDEGCL